MGIYFSEKGISNYSDYWLLYRWFVLENSLFPLYEIKKLNYMNSYFGMKSITGAFFSIPFFSRKPWPRSNG